MPYWTTGDLPDAVRNNLPPHALEIYLAAFNSAWDNYSDPDDRQDNSSREETAHKVAWSAVKQQYEKVGDQWQTKSR